MNCTRHPHKRVIASCRECGTGFCIECVRETDQTTLCPRCHRRKLDAIASEFEPAGKESMPTERSALEEATSVTLEGEAKPAELPESIEPVYPGTEEKQATRVEERQGRGMRGLIRPRDEGKRTEDKDKPLAPQMRRAGFGDAGSGIEEVEEAALEETTADFLALGPDEDFSDLASVSRRSVFRLPWKNRPEEKAEAGEKDTELREGEGSREAGPGRGPTHRQARPRRASHRKPQLPARGSDSEEALLNDVVSALLRPDEAEKEKEAERKRKAKEETSTAESVDEVLSTLLRPGAEVVPEIEPEGEAGEAGRARSEVAVTAAEPEVLGEGVETAAPRKTRRKVPGRWDFLAQPRSSDFTYISDTKWGAVVFTVIMLLLGIILWAAPNAFLIPRDDEYGIHAVAIGIVLGLLFWWKAGRKHGTKLAVQASLTTFFALILGEFAHWFLQILKNSALRTIFFDLVSFRFLREHGAEIMQHVVEAMFPGAFIWIIVLPTLLAFIIGFGMPPIPEVFFQAGRAIKG